MTKTRRHMAEYIKQVDAVCEVVDARIPQVSRNPDMDQIAAGKPRLMVLNRIDLARSGDDCRVGETFPRAGHGGH